MARGWKNWDRRRPRVLRAGIVVLCTLIIGAASQGDTARADDVLTYHNGPSRAGLYRVPDLTLGAARSLHLDPKFHGAVQGHVYAQPLYWHSAAGRALLVVATESNFVYALDAQSGQVVWRTGLGPPVPRSALPCGNIDPVGVTGTPVIDPKAGVVYLASASRNLDRPLQRIFALSLKDGGIVPGWPLDVGGELRKRKLAFSERIQQQRGALLLLGSALYVPYGGAWGDCGRYRGTVVQIETASPKLDAVWQTRANGGGIWAIGGPSSDGVSIFVTTGNTFDAKEWSDGEAILRLKAGLGRSNDPRDFFTPSNWQRLDETDTDLGGTGALPIDIFSGASPAARVMAFGKDGNAYLTDRANLGGIGKDIAHAHVSESQIITAPVAYATKDATMVAFTNGGGGKCAARSITALRIVASGNAPIAPAWCAALDGAGAPIVTTTDGISDAIVWVTGAEGDNLLHGFDGQSGKVVFDGGRTRLSGLRHFGTLIAADDRLYVGADNAVYAFTFGSR
jgi:outer membrane protein assembly factor BamB